MALRIILIFSLCLSVQAIAKKKKRRSSSASIIRAAAVLHKKGMYSKSNQLLRRKYNLRKLKSTPSTVYYIYAQNLFKAGQHAKSINYFNLLIKKRYLRAHVKTLRAFKKDEVDEDQVPKILKQTYFYMGLSYHALYQQRSADVYLNKSKRYLKICDDVDFSSKCGEVLEKLNAQEQRRILERNNYEFFIYAGRILHQDAVYLINASTSEEIEILSNNQALCYGGGLRLTNAFRGYELSGCLYSGNATVQSQGGSINYKQSGVPIAGFLTELGYFWKPDDNKTRIGLSGSMFFRSGLYSEPDGWTIKNNRSTSLGYVLTVGHQFSFTEVLMKIGKYGTQNMLSFNLALNY